MSAARDARRDELFDLAVASSDGFTVDDVIARYGWRHDQVNEAVRDLRRFLGDVGDTINLPCDPQGKGERWVYRLVGDLDSVRAWAANRVIDAESRVRTMEAVLSSMVAATDGRTIAGRKARIMQRALHRLVEDLDDLISGP